MRDIFLCAITSARRALIACNFRSLLAWSHSSLPSRHKVHWAMAAQYPYDVDLLRNGAGAGDNVVVGFPKIGLLRLDDVLMILAILPSCNHIQVAFMQGLPLFTPAAIRPCPLATSATLLFLLHIQAGLLLRSTTMVFREMVRGAHPLLSLRRNTSSRLRKMAPYHRNRESSREEIWS